MKIVFMGTPEFAVPSLEILHKSGYNIVAVVTAPDKPKGRGKKMSGTPVKEYADANNLRVLQPTKLKSEEFVSELKSLNVDLQIVVAFRMLPEVVWSMPALGTFNLHASLLPNYRGAAPINWAIINGETKTGATTFFLKHEIDTGNIIDSIQEPISETDCVGDLYNRLMHKGAELVKSTVAKIESGKVVTREQLLTPELKSAPKIFKETCEINWDSSSLKIFNFIRGLSPYPAAWTVLNNKTFKIFGSKISNRSFPIDSKVGEISTDQKNYLSIKTLDSSIDILDLQMEGKKRMSIEELLRGYRFDAN